MQENNKKRKIFSIFVTILLIGILVLGGIYIHNTRKKRNTYQSQNNTDYEVTLNPNNYFINNPLESNHSYIAGSIQHIDIYFDYYIKNKTKEKMDYSYGLTATIKSYADNGTKLIWTKDFILKTRNHLKEKEIQIKENYQLDYQYYVNYVKSFQEYYHIKTENYLSIKLNVKIDDKDNPSVELMIPLNENVIELTMKEENALSENDNQSIFIEILSVFMIGIVIIYLVSKILFSNNSEETILKDYQDIIIPIQKEPNRNIDDVLYLTSLKDLIHIAINHNSYIFHYQNNYYTVIDHIYYIYQLKKST